MDFQLASLGPLIGLVVVIDIAQQQTIGRFMDDHPNIAAHPYRPKALVPGLVELVKAHARMGRVDLQIKGRCFDGLLLITVEFGEAVGEGVGDAKIHHYYLFVIFGPI